MVVNMLQFSLCRQPLMCSKFNNVLYEVKWEERRPKNDYTTPVFQVKKELIAYKNHHSKSWMFSWLDSQPVVPTGKQN